ncbi:MAG TPA: tRNA (adenosine(37)-N6)-threonylcarbamoyltransferase complex dimerization subunit type 1 TsaB [Pyrinomonadaceae bacterium]|nr:tRNA (adenosine(37)-N6)-threonylcarbamoyltransferase complex dimerization subunit type 1 TsaB [Pyrinomonadaceae bacterium]
METHRRITLAIEAAIAGGSISLIDDSGEIANWLGDAGANRAAEELLPAIDDLLTEHNINPGDIGLIAASAGPGSFTGIRIGLSTALGLKAGWGIPMASESALLAMAVATSVSGDLIAAIPAGRSGIYWQRFSRTEEGGANPTSGPNAATGEDFEKVLETEAAFFIFHSFLANQHPASSRIIDFGENIAHAVGVYCRANPEAFTEPLFISKGRT